MLRTIRAKTFGTLLKILNNNEKVLIPLDRDNSREYCLLGSNNDVVPDLLCSVLTLDKSLFF